MIHFALLLVIVLGIAAIVVIAVRAMGIPIPPWIAQIVGVIFVVIVAVYAIKFLAANL